MEYRPVFRQITLNDIEFVKQLGSRSERMAKYFRINMLIRSRFSSII